MNIVVLGGTGFIGSHAVRSLAAAGHRVTVFSRGRRPFEAPKEASFLTGDYDNLIEYGEQLRRLKPDVVLDMIPITEQNALNVVAVFRGFAGRLVAASSQDVYRAWGYIRGTDSGPMHSQITEDSPLRESRYPYRGLKLPIYPEWDLENYDKILVERAFQTCAELPATIIRLPMVYGPGDPGHRVFPYLKRMDDGRTAIPMEQGAAGWRGPLGYVEDVAAALALAVTSNAASGRVYNVAEPDARSTADFIREIGRAVGWNGRVVELPKGVLAGPWDAFRTDQHAVVDSSRIRRELGYSETTPRMEALRRTIEWQRVHPPEPFSVEMFDYAAEDRALQSCDLSAKQSAPNPI